MKVKCNNASNTIICDECEHNAVHNCGEYCLVNFCKVLQQPAKCEEVLDGRKKDL